MKKSFDTILVGAGHNSLVCANYLSRAGQSVLILERSSETGGLAAPYEFQPGYRVPVAHSANHFPLSIANDLDLADHGCQMESTPVSLTGVGNSSETVRISGLDIQGVGSEDQTAWKQYCERMERFAKALAPSWLETMPRIGYHGMSDLMTFGRLGLKLKGLGKKELGEFLRVFSLPMRDLMDENFESPVLKAMLSWDGLIGSRMAPRSPNNAIPMLLYRMAGQSEGQAHVPVGGVTNLISALNDSAVAAGVEIRTMTGVASIEVNGSESGLAAYAVKLEDGSVIETDRVVSSLDPKTTFFNLVGVENLEIGFTSRIRRFRSQGLVAKLHLALDGLPEFTGVESPGDRIIIADDMDHIEFAFDDSKYGQDSQNPVLEVSIPSTTQPELAPDGHHVLSVHVMYVPHERKGGWTFEARQGLAGRIMAILEQHAPGITDRVVGHELLTPADIESQFGSSGGHWHHGEFALDQMLMTRPTYEAAQYTTPISGLFLCGAGCHPAGDLTGAAGHNAAKAILR